MNDAATHVSVQAHTHRHTHRHTHAPPPHTHVYVYAYMYIKFDGIFKCAGQKHEIVYPISHFEFFNPQKDVEQGFIPFKFSLSILIFCLHCW